MGSARPGLRLVAYASESATYKIVLRSESGSQI